MIEFLQIPLQFLSQYYYFLLIGESSKPHKRCEKWSERGSA